MSPMWKQLQLAGDKSRRQERIKSRSESGCGGAIGSGEDAEEGFHTDDRLRVGCCTVHKGGAHSSANDHRLPAPAILRSPGSFRSHVECSAGSGTRDVSVAGSIKTPVYCGTTDHQDFTPRRFSHGRMFGGPHYDNATLTHVT
eukprot:1180487-Prorocentrum_minimum.AAC.4